MRPSENLRLAGRVSGFLLDLYAMSHSLPAGHFQRAVLTRLRNELPFRSAWWGMLRDQPGSALTLHSAYADALPDDFATCWEAVKYDDELAAQVLATPGVASCVAVADLRRKVDLSLMAQRFGIGSAMSIAVTDRGLNLNTFLSLYRGTDAPPFDANERGLQEILMPHLVAAWRTNWLQHLDAVRAHREGARRSMAVIDRHGLLHFADASFSDMMRSEWPRWHRSALPAPLHDAIAGRRRYDGRRLRVEAWREHDLIVLQVYPRSPFDQLSPREAQVAACYRDGLSYKEISVRLACSPFTVRHHLRAIYDKLGVSNKAEFIRLVGAERSPDARFG